jgi:hypothetical protein
MIKSKFITEIVELILKGNKDSESLMHQIPFLSESKYDYTGVGLYVDFSHSPEAAVYKIDEAQRVITGIQILSEDLDASGGGAILFLKGGIISTLEIYTYTGSYPRKELANYTLRRDSWE